MSYTPADLSIRLLDKPCLIADYPGSSPEETILAGKYGLIWKYADDTYYVVVTTPHIYKKFCVGSLVRGEEIGLTCDYQEACRWVKRLKVSGVRTTQVKNLQIIMNCLGEVYESRSR